MLNISTGEPFRDDVNRRVHAHHHPSIDGASIAGYGLVTGRARGLMGGAFMGAMLAQQGASKQYTASDYITDGAFFIFDVRENAGPGVHSASKVAYDFATGRSDNFSSFQDGYVTNMTADYLEAPDIATQYLAFRFRQDVAIPYTSEARTVEIVELISADYIAAQTGTWRANLQILGNSAVVSQLRDDTTTLRLGLSSSNPQAYAYVYISDIPTLFTAIHTFTSVVKEGGPSQLYVDGTKLAESNNSPSVYTYSTLPTLALYYGRGHRRLYNVRTYNRVLTAAEIAANYAVDKARFGLA